MQAEMTQISALFQQGNLDAARKLCRELVQKHPTSDKVRYAHAMICQQAGDLEAAISAYQTTVKISPSHLQALANLGGLLVSAGRHNEAVAPLERAVKLAPNSAPARYNLAQAYHGLGKTQAALNEAMQARALDDTVPDIHSFIGLVNEDMRKHAEAAAAYGQLASLVPDKVGPKLMQASNLQMNGQFEAAEEVLNQALKQHPNEPGIHVQLGVGKRSVEQEASSISALEKAVDENNLSDTNEIRARFVLGDLLDRAGDYDRAFVHYQEANRLKKAREPYDSKVFQAMTDAIIATFTPAYYAERSDYGHASEQPVFVFGMPRSGTTLLERLLASHPDSVGVGELDHFSSRCRQEEFGPMPAPLPVAEAAACSKEQIAEFADRYLSTLPERGRTAVRTVDSTPGNIGQLGLIRLTFPKAHLIYSQRNLLDTALSGFFQNFADGAVLFANDLSDIVVVQQCHAQLISHYEQVLGLDIHRSSYEDNIADAKGQISRLLSLIGLDAGLASFDNTASSDPIQSSSVWQARQPIYSTSVERWRNYEKHIGPLIDGLADLEI